MAVSHLLTLYCILPSMITWKCQPKLQIILYLYAIWGYTRKGNFYMVIDLHFYALGAALWYLLRNTWQAAMSWQNWTCHHLGYSVPPAHHHTIWCRSTFGLRGPGLSNPTSFLRPALPMVPTTDNNARDEQSVLRPNPATFLRDFSLYITSKDATYFIKNVCKL